jgi:hypothetical protein
MAQTKKSAVTKMGHTLSKEQKIRTDQHNWGNESQRLNYSQVEAVMALNKKKTKNLMKTFLKRRKHWKRYHLRN